MLKDATTMAWSGPQPQRRTTEPAAYLTRAGSVPFSCTNCAAKATLRNKARFCLKCGKPVPPVESAANDDPRRVNESDDTAAKLEGLSLLELRRAVGASVPDRPKPGPIPASSIRADVEFLAGYWIRTKAAEQDAIDRFARG